MTTIALLLITVSLWNWYLQKTAPVNEPKSTLLPMPQENHNRLKQHKRDRQRRAQRNTSNPLYYEQMQLQRTRGRQLGKHILTQLALWYTTKEIKEAKATTHYTTLHCTHLVVTNILVMAAARVTGREQLTKTQWLTGSLGLAVFAYMLLRILMHEEKEEEENEQKHQDRELDHDNIIIQRRNVAEEEEPIVDTQTTSSVEDTKQTQETQRKHMTTLGGGTRTPTHKALQHIPPSYMIEEQKVAYQALRNIIHLLQQNHIQLPTELYAIYKANRQQLREMPQLHYPHGTQINTPRDHTYQRYAQQYYPADKTTIPGQWWQDQHLTPLFSTGDGSCFYNSASILLTGTERWSMRIRMVCATMLFLHHQILHLDTETMKEELRQIANPYGAVYPSTAGLLLATVTARPVMILTPQTPDTSIHTLPAAVLGLLMQDSGVYRPLTMYNTELHPLIIGRAQYVTSKDKVGKEHAASLELLQNLNHYIPIATSDAHTAYTLMQLPWLKQHGTAPRRLQIATDMDESQLLMDHEHLAELRMSTALPEHNEQPHVAQEGTPTPETTPQRQNAPDPHQDDQPTQLREDERNVKHKPNQVRQPAHNTPTQGPDQTKIPTYDPTSRLTGPTHRRHMTNKQRRHLRNRRVSSTHSTVQATQRTIEQTLQQ